MIMSADIFRRNGERVKGISVQCYNPSSMFTGIVEATAEVLDVSARGMTLSRPKHFDDLRIGSSIAVCGACLSVTSFDEKKMTFDLADTTLEKTKLGQLKRGDQVNLERAMKANGRFEGHIVQGHVDGVGEVTEMAGTLLRVRLPIDLRMYVMPQGSITVDGVSLTIADIHDHDITLALIPLTLSETTLGSLRTGDAVNIEADILSKYLTFHANQ